MSNKVDIVCLGPIGSHSYAATKHLFPDNNIITKPSITAVINTIDESKATLAVLPIENSLEGSINITLDTLARKNKFSILNELVWSIRHHLLSFDEISPIKTIISHPQALAQCRKNLHEKFKNVVLEETSSTSHAASLASKNKNIAALASIDAAKIFNLKIRHKDMQDITINSTRFITISSKPFVKAEKNATKTSIICEIDGEKSGTLYELLKEFALRNVNLVRIESRPARTVLGRYIFFLDFDGSIDEPNIKEALDIISQNIHWLKILGSYPVIKA